MKLSKYNYYIKDSESHHYWFNGITQFFFKIESTLSDKLRSNLTNDINEIKHKLPSFYKNLKDKGFIIEESTNEIDAIRKLNKQVSNSKNYFLIILPTLNCNFNCWYCVQDHVETKMNEQTLSMVKEHLRNMIVKEKITSLHIEWFGGEPFLYFDEIIHPLSKFALNLCKKKEIPFRNTATTNGYFLTDKVASSLEGLSFKHFQISIDGTRNQHNKVKKSKFNDSAYDTSLNNINNILNKINSIEITLRLNYSDKNLKESIIEEVNEIIESKNRSRIKIIFRRIWQEKTDGSRSKKITNLITNFEDAGYCTSRWDLDNGFIPCYADKKYYNAINYNGNVLKCTANDDLQHSDSPGKLEKDGIITWKEGILDKIYKKRFENELCLSCTDLPLCMGNCSREYKVEDTNKIEPICIKNLDLSFEELILNYCKEKQISSA